MFLFGVILLVVGAVVVFFSNKWIDFFKLAKKDKVVEETAVEELEDLQHNEDIGMEQFDGGLIVTVKIIGFSIAAVGAVLILIA